MVPAMSSEVEILHEAKMLREHKDRLESRMKILEVHNNQLENQLGKLKTMLNDSNGGSNANNGGSGIMAAAMNNMTIMSNKTGTLNTKSVTASQLATNSPILPHKMNGNGSINNQGLGLDKNGGRGEPPALPPRGVSRQNSRDASLTRNKPPPPAVPPKRSSLTRSDLALFSAENVS